MGRPEDRQSGADATGDEADDPIAAIALSALRHPDTTWDAHRRVAAEIKDDALLPVLGAGASYPCRVPLASDLGWKLVEAVEDRRIPIGAAPSDYADYRGEAASTPIRPSDLGRLADLICLDRPVKIVLDELAFADRSVWPPGEELAKAHRTEPHRCAYRILARMTRERFISEAVTFNYDCHFEGALLKEGFQTTGRRRSYKQWPQRFDVVADARANAQLIPRGDFVLNKVHGCVETWRNRRSEAKDATAEEAADASIVIRWSQLLDWRGDLWAQDLFRDRARRHVLILIGFGGADPVIHSSLRAVLDEVRQESDASVSRVRVIDLHPDTLTLRLLVAAGRGTLAAGNVEQLSVAGIGLPETLLIIQSELVRLVLVEEAQARGRSAAIAEDPREALVQLSVAVPPMVRWTAALLQSTAAVVTGTAEAIDEYRDDLYVPLGATPARTLQILQTEQQLVKELLTVRDAADGLLSMGFYRKPRDPRAFIATGLEPDELQRVASDGTLRAVAERLATPDGLFAVAVAEAHGRLHFYAVETGRPVKL
jgi:hypothetical protein